MFYIVKYISRIDDFRIQQAAASSISDLFSLVCVLDQSSICTAWKIEGVKDMKSQFGWANEGWNKARLDGFKQEDFK